MIPDRTSSLRSALERTQNPNRRGAALMLAIVVLMVILLIVYQIAYTAKTDARVSRNEEALMWMDNSIESVLLQVYEDLKLDAESAGGEEEDGAGGLGGLGGGGGGGFGQEDEAGGEDGPTDSLEDEWRRAQRTELNDMRLRILVQDEDSKFNVLSILTENEDESGKAYERLVRIIDFARGGTEDDIDGGDARRMADGMLEFMNRRLDQRIPKPELLSDNKDNDDWGFPLDLREFVVVEGFEEKHFRDYRDERDNVVHSLGSFLTVWTSLGTADMEAGVGQGAGGAPDGGVDPATDDTNGAGGADGAGSLTGSDGQSTATSDGVDQSESTGGGGGGGGSGGAIAGSTTDATMINVNTAPAAVLKAMFDDREVPLAFWDEVLEYRNKEDEEAAEETEDEDPALDEFGEELIQRQVFTNVSELESLDGWGSLEPEMQAEVQARFKVSSDVFSIYITARKPTSVNSDDEMLGDREALEREETEGTGLIRTVRSVVWRQSGDEETAIAPLIRWEVLDYVPFEIRDFPDEER